MRITWKAASKGIRYYEHASRKYGKRPDRYYILTYKRNGKTHSESLGWESENRTPGESLLRRGEKILALLRENWRTGEGPQTLAEMREESVKRREADTARAESEARRHISLDKFFEEEFKSYALRSKKTSSAQKEFALYQSWIKPMLGNTPIINIDIRAWESLLSQLDRSPLARSTKKYICGTLCRILRHAKNLDYQVDIPSMKRLGLSFIGDNRRTRIISKDEIKKVLEELKIRDKKAYRIVLFGVLTGCRFSEAANLKWNDISENGIVFRNTKNRTSRIIPLTEHLEKLFKDIERGCNSEIVFTNTQGNKYKEAPQAFKNVVKKLNLNLGRDVHDRISFHTFRHTVATELGKSLDLRSLMDTLGWSQVTMAARYMHGDEERKKKALDMLGNMIEDKQSAKVIKFNSQNSG